MLLNGANDEFSRDHFGPSNVATFRFSRTSVFYNNSGASDRPAFPYPSRIRNVS